MNGQSLAIIRDAAVFTGELKREVIAAGVVIAICLVILAIQIFQERRSR